MTDSKKAADKGPVTTAVTKAVNAETHAERVTRETTEAGNVVKGSTEPSSRRDLKHDTVPVDEQAEINRQVLEQQKSTGSTLPKGVK